MTHIANVRLRKGGRYYAPGERVDLTADELAGLPEGVVSEVTDDAPGADNPPVSGESNATLLNAAAADLTDADFKKDGDIRADSLRTLAETLGFDVTAEEVAAARAASTGGEKA